MTKKHVILNPKYPNDFLTTQIGPTFYQKDNVLGKAHTSHEIDLDDTHYVEIRRLVEQGILSVVDEPIVGKAKPIKDRPPILGDQKGPKPDMVETKKEAGIMKDTPGDTIREVKTEKNDERITEMKESLQEKEAVSEDPVEDVEEPENPFSQ